MSEDRITDLVGKLHGLLKNPHPGLSTWHDARISIAKDLYKALAEALHEQEWSPPTEDPLLGSTVMSEVFGALGWQGGTIHAALDEVRRLRHAGIDAQVEGYMQALRTVAACLELPEPKNQRPWDATKELLIKIRHAREVPEAPDAPPDLELAPETEEGVAREEHRQATEPDSEPQE